MPAMCLCSCQLVAAVLTVLLLLPGCDEIVNLPTEIKFEPTITVFVGIDVVLLLKGLGRRLMGTIAFKKSSKNSNKR